MRRAMACGACIWFLLAAPVSAKAEDKTGQNRGSLVGKKVIPVRPDVVLRLGPAEGARRVDFTPSCNAVEVEAEQGEWLDCGSFWLRRSDVIPLSEAIAYFTQQTERSPNAYAYVARSRAWLHAEGDSKHSLADAEAAIRLNPKFALTWLSRAECRLLSRRYSDAVSDLKHAVALDPRLFSARFELAIAHQDAKDLDGAIAACTAGLKLWPSHYGLLMLRAILGAYRAERHESENCPGLAEQDYTHAIEDMRAAIAEPAATGQFRHAVSPTARASGARVLSTFYAARACIRFDARRFDATIADWNQAIRFRPDDSFAYVNRGQALWELGKEPEAIDDFKAAVRVDPASENLHERIGLEFAIHGSYPQAIEHFTQAIKLAPENPELYRERAVTWRRMWKFLKARRDFAEAKRLKTAQRAQTEERRRR